MTRKAIFNAIREARGKGFDQMEVGAIDNLLDALGVPMDKSVRTTSHEGVRLIQEFEGCKLTAYPDPGTGGDPWTIGWGATGPGIKRGVVWTQKQADERLLADLIRFEDAVNKYTGRVTTQPQFDAMVSFAFNVGTEAFRTSTLLRKHNEGDYAGAAEQFARWNKAGGRVLAGLTRRRAAEAALYRKGAA